MERRKTRADELEARLATVEKDYESYKVRAQSVLRQAKDKVNYEVGPIKLLKPKLHQN